jgi:hypothetical protein
MVPTATTLGRLIEGALAVGDIEVLVTVPLWPKSSRGFLIHGACLDGFSG